MGKHYVVFEGDTPCVYDNWPDCKEQVHGVSGNSYCSFPTKEEAEREYARYVAKKNKDTGFAESKLGFQCSGTSEPSVGTDPVAFADTRDVDSELLGITMQNWLSRTSWTLLRTEPLYSKHSVIQIGGIEYTCYNVKYVPSLIGEASSTVGRFAKGDFLAREDATLFLLRRLLAWTNKEIVDFNFFNLREVEMENEIFQAQNIDLIVENEKLKKEDLGHREAIREARWLLGILPIMRQELLSPFVLSLGSDDGSLGKRMLGETAMVEGKQQPTADLTQLKGKGVAEECVHVEVSHAEAASTVDAVVVSDSDNEKIGDDNRVVLRMTGVVKVVKAFTFHRL
ncbi:hypothetical protein RIF29_25339 [Crotalaria pallida]|uniref:Ribonuclease H1 N-terminal domain-containing protein n=1 Tax=Crotalaria pallida TaxID=3830 RepID=A0AAN9ENU0_CROPI